MARTRRLGSAVLAVALACSPTANGGAQEARLLVFSRTAAFRLRDVQPGLTVLLEIDETTYKSPDQNPAPEPRPIAWVTGS